MNQKQEVDNGVVRELDLYWSNDEPLYTTSQEWVKLYLRKTKRGAYSERLALQGIVNNFVPMIIKSYRKEFGLGKVNLATKQELGKEIMISIRDAMDYQLNEEKEVA